MNDNRPPSSTEMMPITVAMVESGIAILDELTAVDTPEEDCTDAQLVIAIFSRMWQTKLREEQAIRLGKLPKSALIKPNSNILLMPHTKGKP